MVKKGKNLGKILSEAIWIQKSRAFRLSGKEATDSFEVTPLLTEQSVEKGRRPVSFWRLSFFPLVLILVIVIIFARLFVLQIIQGKESRQRSENNRILLRPIHAPRGVVFDRNGKFLARNTAGFRLVKGTEVKVLDRDTALALESQGLVTEGIEEGELGRLEIDSVRQYIQGPQTVHLLGYVSQISQEELESGNFANYSVGDRIGRLGIEEFYEKYLRGTDGAELVEVDALGEKLRLLGERKPKAGDNLYLAIDIDLQKKMFETLKAQVEKIGSSGGTAIAQNPQTGEILGLVSVPAFDNNQIIKGMSQENFTKLVSDPQKPMFDRAIGGTYPPGSIFKMVSALAGLESGKILPSTQFEDTGEIFLGEYRFPNWYYVSYGKKEGMLDIVGAIRRSNDIFFYRVGQVVGEEILGRWAKKLGLGEKLGIDLPGEESGLVPTREWKEKVKGEIWLPGNTLHMAIGQGDVLATPLQLTNLTSFVANSGTLFVPHLATRIVDQEGKVSKSFGSEILAQNIVSRGNLDLVRTGLKLACGEGGTGWPFFDFAKKHDGMMVGCKTGTAEFAGNEPHAWFTVFAPFDNPKIALTILIENGGEGSSIAGPVAREILDWYFQKEK